MIFSPTLSMCFGCSGEPSQWDGSFEYPQQMFFLTYIKHVFWVLKGTVSSRLFFWVPTTYVLDED